MRTALFLAFSLALSFASAGNTAAQPQKEPKKPLQIYTEFRLILSEGKFDIAAVYLEEFLKSNPSDDDFLAIEKQYGTTAFQQLRTVPRYSDDPAREKRIRELIEELNRRAKEVTDKVLRNKERVLKFIANLGASYEEKVFAQQELKRTGDFAIPFLVDAIRMNPDPELYRGILETIPVLDGPTMGGWVAVLDHLGTDRQLGILEALAARRDVLDLLTNAQTDFTPHLWRILAKDPQTVPQNLRVLALNLLNRFYPGVKADSKRPEVELTAIAKTFYEHQARYLDVKTHPDATPTTTALWVTTDRDGVLVLNKLPDVPVRQADEYFGLKYARWALESKPEHEPAQLLILALAAERGIERANYGPLATAEPAVYALLADAPSRPLMDLLARGLNEKRTSLVLAMLQVLGDRADRAAATPPAGPAPRDALLVRALRYDHPAVQFAAATAILRAPLQPPAEAKRLIVDILRRAAASDPGTPPESKGTLLLVDPNPFRTSNNSVLLRGLGFKVETFTTGRQLLRRVAKASDFDILVIDRHTADPELIDLVAQLEANPQVAQRPIYIVASTDKPRPPRFDQLLLRMAALIAATENDVIAMPPPYLPDPRFTPAQQAEEKQKIQEARDNRYRNAAANRTARLQRVIDTLPLTLTETQRRLMNLRIQLITYAILGVEFPFSADSAPETVAELNRIRKQLTLQPPTPDYGTGIATTDLMKLIERFEIDVAKAPFAYDRYDRLLSQVDPVELGLQVETYRDQELEAKLARTFREYPHIRIIPEPYSRTNIQQGLAILRQDPAMAPRDPTHRLAQAKLAIDYLRRMAIGEIPGYDLTAAELELREALGHPDVEIVSAAIDAVARFKSAAAQEALLKAALRDVRNRPVEVRLKAADALIRHIRQHGNALPANLMAQLMDQANPQSTPEADLRGRLLTLKGMLAHQPQQFVDQLKRYNPPIIPVPSPEPKKNPEPSPEPKKDPEPKNDPAP